MTWWLKLILIGAALAAVGAGVHWYNEGIRETQRLADQAKYDKALIGAQEDARKQTEAWLKKFKEKDDETTKKYAELDARFKFVNNANGILRDKLTAYAIGAAQLTPASCAEGIQALSTVFGQCLDRYTEMGKHATGHLIDSEDCRAKWPEDAK